MAVSSRVLHSFVPQREMICSRCLGFSTTATVQSGHNRWSKIKHDKGAADIKKNVLRSGYAKQIALASKLGGDDLKFNAKLVAILAAAKKAGFPKTSMDAAIARGQGRSATGGALEALTIECIMPGQVALIIEAETDNRNRAMADLRLIIKDNGGITTPCSYLFQRKGRIAFAKDENGVGVDDVLDNAIEAGAEDVELDEDGGIVVWTEPNMTNAAADALSQSHGLKLESSDIIWDANADTKVEIQEEEAATLIKFLDFMYDTPYTQGVYGNLSQGSLSEEVWEALQEKVDL